MLEQAVRVRRGDVDDHRRFETCRRDRRNRLRGRRRAPAARGRDAAGLALCVAQIGEALSASARSARTRSLNDRSRRRSECVPASSPSIELRQQLAADRSRAEQHDVRHTPTRSLRDAAMLGGNGVQSRA